MKKIAEELLKIAEELTATPVDKKEEAQKEFLKKEILSQIKEIEYKAEIILNFAKRMDEFAKKQGWDTKEELDILKTWESELGFAHQDGIATLRALHKIMGNRNA